MATDNDDNTQVQAGATGNSMRTDAATRDKDGTIVHTAVVKLAVGAKHEPARLVEEHEPFPIFDRANYELNLQLLEVMTEIRDLLRGRRR